MKLLFSAGGNDARNLSELLGKEGIACLCCYPTLDDAGNYGSGNVIVGERNEQSLTEIIQDNQIDTVIDVISGPSPDDSLLAIKLCSRLGCRYLKYLRPPVDASEYGNVYFCDSYSKIVEAVNRNIGNVVLYLEPKNARALAERILDKSCLYAPIPREVSFNVELALQYGLSLTNVVEVDSPEEEDSVAHVIEKYQASFLICDSGGNIAEKSRAAARFGINVLLTNRMGIDFPGTAESFEQVVEYLKMERETNELENDQSCN